MTISLGTSKIPHSVAFIIVCLTRMFLSLHYPVKIQIGLHKVDLRCHIYKTKLSLTLIPTLISNYIHYKVWDDITYPFINFNGATVEV